MSFQKDEMNSTITFEYEGKKYSMTAEEIEAAYRYQERQYRREDAKYWVFEFIYGDGEADPDNLDEDQEDNLSAFEACHHISPEELMRSLDRIVQNFDDDFDCSIDSQTQWVEAIRKTLYQIRYYY